jgi:hypothetical protein
MRIFETTRIECHYGSNHLTMEWQGPKHVVRFWRIKKLLVAFADHIYIYNFILYVYIVYIFISVLFSHYLAHVYETAELNSVPSVAGMFRATRIVWAVSYKDRTTDNRELWCVVSVVSSHFLFAFCEARWSGYSKSSEDLVFELPVFRPSRIWRVLTTLRTRILDFVHRPEF